MQVYFLLLPKLSKLRGATPDTHPFYLKLSTYFHLPLTIFFRNKPKLSFWFKVIFLSFFGPLIILFGLQVASAMGFKSRVDSNDCVFCHLRAMDSSDPPMSVTRRFKRTLKKQNRRRKWNPLRRPLLHQNPASFLSRH